MLQRRSKLLCCAYPSKRLNRQYEKFGRDKKIVLAGPNPEAPKEDSRHGDKSCALRARRRAPLGRRVSVRNRAARRRLSHHCGADRAWGSRLAPGLGESAERSVSIRR